MALFISMSEKYKELYSLPVASHLILDRTDSTVKPDSPNYLLKQS